jgi:phosphoribosylformimino-5-aminoimidazole carboxamide ribotide isomerase
MRVIPVIDLMNGQVVRGVAGRRSEYRPIESQIAVDARPATIARAFVEHFGFDAVYVADIDAIQGGPPNLEAWEAIKDAGLTLWLDAGVRNAQGYSELNDLLLARDVDAAIVVATECLEDPYDDRWWDDATGPQRPAIFSLDLKGGVPIHQISAWRQMSPLDIGRSVYELCFRDIIVLDLADVGVNGGTRTLDLCRQLFDELNEARIIAGGGVRGIADLRAMAATGCYAALVASALHDGPLTREDIRQIESLGR